MTEQKKDPFYDWITTFWEEKGLDYSETMPNGKGETIQAGDVVQAIINAPDSERRMIKETIIKIDFRNGDLMHFIRHLAKAL